MRPYLWNLGTARSWTWSTSAMQCRPGWRWSFPLASYYYGTARISLSRWCILPYNPFPYWLSLQTTKSRLHNTHLPSKHQQQWQHLSGYSSFTMVTCSHNFQRFVCSYLLVNFGFLQCCWASVLFCVIQIQMTLLFLKLLASTKQIVIVIISLRENGMTLDIWIR